MDFYKVRERSTKNGVIEVYPDFLVARSKDLMVRGGSFYAIWDSAKGLWSTDEYDVQLLVDNALWQHRDDVASRTDGPVRVQLLGEFSSGMWVKFKNYVKAMSDSSVQLDAKLTFSNTEVKKSDYVSRRLPYPLEPGETSAWDEMIGTLYSPEERAKIEWAIGAIVAGDAKDIQKFVVLYGAAGTGKSTIMSIVQKLFAGYYTTFEAKALTSTSNAFSTEVFKANPLVAIQHDGDLSKIEDNTKLNSIVSHEDMTMNEKFKASYMSRINAFLFMGTNKPVKITDAKSGIIRRLIDVQPSGDRIPPTRYQALMAQIEFELGGIAWNCLQLYREMGRDYYSSYRPVEMMLQTDVFYNYIETYFHLFKEQNGASLAQAYELYKTYCSETNVDFVLPRYKFREELKNYFGTFSEQTRIDGKQVRSYYSDFLAGKFIVSERAEEQHPYSLVMSETNSLFDEMCAELPAQYANVNETPIKRWAEVDTKLSDLDTSKLHYVKPPANHIVIDFDLKDATGAKSLELNLEAASKWPSTYSELSKGGSGIHLHYIYTGDTSVLSRIFDEGIEIKVFNGDASLRRRLSKCNNVPVSTLNSGLPLKEKRVIDFEAVKSERALRELIFRNLRKEIHPATKPSVDFIHKILEDAHASGLTYDLTDLKTKVLLFAASSNNQAEYCIKLIDSMKFASDDAEDKVAKDGLAPIAFFDCEVFPNLFVVSWKYVGAPVVNRMVNPTPLEIEAILKLRLIGFNCRKYDNHIIYARLMGYSIEKLYELSQRIVSNDRTAYFAEAYALSYADIYDYSSKKQSLKRWQIELGLNHKELGLPWNEPVPDDMIDLVGEYCDNDVITTEQTHLARSEDFAARRLLAELSGLTVNDTTQRHTARIIFGTDKNPQEKFVYTDLKGMFPGYEYSYGKSTYRGEVTGEGGYVYAEPGMYTNVALLDIASMHPTSLINLNAFGPYTGRFKELLDARLCIKHKEYDKARTLLDGKLAPYLEDESKSKELSYALKIIINIVYGLTSASFDNPFRDPRNVDNIVAKRGALFMVDLKKAVQERGFTVAHIKTDSIKIPDATPEIIKFVTEFGAKYGYSFELEDTYEKLCLVNDAVYIAAERTGEGLHWTSVGAQFSHPYVFKTLFSKEQLEFDDYAETKSVTTALYLDYNEDLPEEEHNYQFVGRAGRFVPVRPGFGGGVLLREKDGDYHAASGTKGYRWYEDSTVSAMQNWADVIDTSYHKKLANAAVDNLSKFGDFEWFVSEDR